jgi:hypothetical protein
MRTVTLPYQRFAPSRVSDGCAGAYLVIQADRFAASRERLLRKTFSAKLGPVLLAWHDRTAERVVGRYGLWPIRRTLPDKLGLIKTSVPRLLLAREAGSRLTTKARLGIRRSGTIGQSPRIMCTLIRVAEDLDSDTWIS